VLFDSHPGQIACVIMMPFEIEPPAAGFLEGVKRLCHENGAVFILDEIRSGFRMARGGAQEYLDVTPDLAALNKGMANGYPISAVVGRRDVMSAVEKGLFSATFFVSAMEMAASLATLEIIERDGVIERLWATGRMLQEGLRQVFADTALEIEVVGYPPMPFVQFTIEDPVQRECAKTAFYTEAAARGIYFHPNHHWFVNFSHTDEDVAQTLDVCASALKAAERALA
jgi:glutamate-1-semialdehyde aminotransferase